MSGMIYDTEALLMNRDEMINELRKRDFMQIPAEGENMYQWTDASKYAKEYYGETMYETTRFDNDWD